MVGKAIELRDALTQYLKGEPLHALDTELALWICNLVERRTRAGTVNAGLATGVARALDSFGDMPEADPLREALPALRRQARLCPKCGQPVSRHETTCAECQPGRSCATGRRRFREPTFRATGAFMSQRVRCKTCRTAFVTDENQAGGVVECPKCGARHRLPAATRKDAGRSRALGTSATGSG